MAVHALRASHNIITISPNTLFNVFVYWFLETLKKKKANYSRLVGGRLHKGIFYKAYIGQMQDK